MFLALTNPNLKPWMRCAAMDTRICRKKGFIAFVGLHKQEGNVNAHCWVNWNFSTMLETGDGFNAGI